MILDTPKPICIGYLGPPCMTAACRTKNKWRMDLRSLAAREFLTLEDVWEERSPKQTTALENVFGLIAERSERQENRIEVMIILCDEHLGESEDARAEVLARLENDCVRVLRVWT